MAALFVVNQQSSRIKKKGSRIKPIAKALKAPLIEADNLEKFKATLQLHVQDKPDHIFIEGGDGTAHIVMTEYFRALEKGRPPASFTLIGGGTTNQVAGNIGTKNVSSDYFKRLIKKDAGTVHTLPLLQVNVDDHAAFYGFLFSSGAIPMATRHYTDNLNDKNTKGPAAVYATILEALGKGTSKTGSFMKSTPIRIVVSDKKDQTIIDEPHLGTITTTLPGFILGIDPFWGKGDAPLRMTYVRGENTKLLGLVLSAALKRFEKLENTDGVESWNADYVEMAYGGPTVLDGEILPVCETKIELRPTQPINFIA